MRYRYLDLITAAFAVVLILSNIAATKIISIGSISFAGAILVFPFAYIFGDILTEVYGYARARRVIWIGFGMNLLMVALFWIVGKLPPDQYWPNQAAYDAILGQVPRIVLGSLVAYLFGEFLNSYALAKLKVKTEGKKLWYRALASTVVGEFFDTTLFLLIAFGGLLPWTLLKTIWITSYTFKIAIELVMLPATYRAVKFLKAKEQVDYFDRETNFNPLSVKSE